MKKTFYKKGFGYKYKYHIVTILENEKPEPIIITKYFGKNKKRWYYEIETLEVFKDCINIGLYFYKKKD